MSGFGGFGLNQRKYAPAPMPPTSNRRRTGSNHRDRRAGGTGAGEGAGGVDMGHDPWGSRYFALPCSRTWGLPASKFVQTSVPASLPGQRTVTLSAFVAA